MHSGLIRCFTATGIAVTLVIMAALQGCGRKAPLTLPSHKHGTPQGQAAQPQVSRPQAASPQVLNPAETAASSPQQYIAP